MAGMRRRFLSFRARAVTGTISSSRYSCGVSDHVLGLHEGKKRCLSACASLAKAFSLASTSDYARGIADDVAFFKGVRTTIVKVSPAGGQSLEEIDLGLQQLISEAVGS
jgi:type I restriction enzyme R subunit